MKFTKQLGNGLFAENPVHVQLIGMCPVLAVSTSVENGIGMGLAATAVLLCSNIVISALRNFIPSKVRIAAYITIIAGFVTMVDLALQAFLPALSASLGLFIPLIVVNCIILGRAEAFASKNSVLHSLGDGVAMGLGFTFALIILSAVREILGAGTLTIPGAGQLFNLEEIGFQPISIFILPAGGFLALGCIIAFIQKMTKKGA